MLNVPYGMVRSRNCDRYGPARFPASQPRKIVSEVTEPPDVGPVKSVRPVSSAAASETSIELENSRKLTSRSSDIQYNSTASAAASSLVTFGACNILKYFGLGISRSSASPA